MDCAFCIRTSGETPSRLISYVGSSSEQNIIPAADCHSSFITFGYSWFIMVKLKLIQELKYLQPIPSEALKANRSLAAICAPVCNSRIFDPENHQFLEEVEEANVPSPLLTNGPLKGPR